MSDEQNLLLEEYKLIQAKIDKLGEDKFKVRSWCFTIVAGILAGAKLSGALADTWNAAFLLSIFFPVIGAFQLVELRQRQIANRFGVRAQQIELIWIRHIDAAGQKHPLTARLASFLIAEGKLERKRCSLRKWIRSRFLSESAQAAETATEMSSRRPRAKTKPATLKECLIARADLLFYITQYFVVAISILFLASHQIYRALVPQNTSHETSLVLHVNTNEFRLDITRTNLQVTNFLEVVRMTTNFVPVTQFTTNFVIRDVIVTNVNGQKRTN